MAKSESDIFTPLDRAGHTSRERHAVFCMWEQPYKNLRHFAVGGKPLGDLIVDVVRHTAEKPLQPDSPSLITRPRL